MAPKETYRKAKNTIRKISKEIPAENGFNPMMIPSAVATPLPPLNCAKTGYTCPMIQTKEVESWKNKS